MQTGKWLASSTEGEQGSNPFINVEASGKTTVNEVPLEGSTTPVGGFALAPLGFIVFLWSLLLLLSKDRVWNFLYQATFKKISLTKSHSQIPCPNCRFFHRNSYLRCAVHPLKVLSREASHCSDYWPCDSEKFPANHG
jgi:hypothetical protein